MSMESPDDTPSDQNTASEKEKIPAFAGMTSGADKKEKKEWGGPKGLEPTRYGDWEVNGRVSDF